MNQEIYDNSDTICAISTPGGVGGIAVIRVSGADAGPVVSKIWKGAEIDLFKSHTAHLGQLFDPESGDVIDEVVLTIFRSPNSFTGETVIELGVHGSTWIQGRVVQLLSEAGARLALPGEFTRRAFLNGKIDLAEAEAVGDLIASQSKSAHRLAISQLKGAFSKRIDSLRDELLQLACLMELELDFAEEEVEFASRDKLRSLTTAIVDEVGKLASSFRRGNAIKRGIPVAIIGATNAGKSSLLNELLEENRAIVSSIHGTTRDVIEDVVTIKDFMVRFMDTAGLRKTDDEIEQLGIERSRVVADKASIVLNVIDASSPVYPEVESIDSRYIFVINKRDIVPVDQIVKFVQEHYPSNKIIAITTNSTKDIEMLRELLFETLRAEMTDNNEVTVTNERHAQALFAAANHLQALLANLDAGIPTDLLAQDLRDAISTLSSITGQITTPTILNQIFANFCIGK